MIFSLIVVISIIILFIDFLHSLYKSHYDPIENIIAKEELEQYKRRKEDEETIRKWLNGDYKNK